MATTETKPETNGQANTTEQPNTEEQQVTRGATRVARGAKVKQRQTGKAQAKTAKANGVAKPKATKAKAAKVNPPRAKGDFRNDQVLTLQKAPEAGTDLAGRYGKLKDGMTVADALEAQKPLRRRRGMIRKLIAGGHITLK